MVNETAHQGASVETAGPDVSQPAPFTGWLILALVLVVLA
jgi:hypothetical protein